MRHQLSLLAALGLLAGAAQAAQDPFYSITEVATSEDTAGAGFGPWAVGMATGSSTRDAVLSRASNNDGYSFFNMAPMALDLAHRHRYEQGCTAVLASAVCSAYWDGMDNGAYQWRADTLSYVSQTWSLLDGSLSDEQDGILTRLGETKYEAVGYKVAVSPTSDSNYYPRTGLLRLASGDIELTSGEDPDSVGGFASAYSLLKLDDDRYLVGGTANTSVSPPDSALELCYEGDADEHYLCPGFNTQAALWLVDPSDSATTSYESVQASAYDEDDADMLQTAAVQGLAEVDGSYWAVGYSSHIYDGSSSTGERNLAVFWPISLSDEGVSLGDLQQIPLDAGVPAEGDGVLRHSWALAINDNGWVIGNQQYGTAKGRNLPIEMFVYQIGSSGNAAVPFADAPSTGSNSEAAALNNVNQVVGWRDERSETQPVYQGSPRLQEAFLYNIDSGNSWRLNDLICGRDEAGSASCAIDGKYYYIAYANAINDDGSIAATAYRYDSYDDWANRNNPTTVSILLNKNSAFEDGDVPDSLVVTNALPANDYGASSGGGALGAPWVLLLGGVGLFRVLRRKK